MAHLRSSRQPDCAESRSGGGLRKLLVAAISSHIVCKDRSRGAAVNVGSVVSVLTVISSLSIKLLGEPDQIRKNYARKSTLGLSPILYGLSLLSYALWTIHGILITDWTIIAAQSLGVLTSSIVLYQIWRYRRTGLIEQKSAELNVSHIDDV